jgi:V8-like Glu-specific endopeptidase
MEQTTPASVGVVLPGDNRAAVHNTTVPPSCWVGSLVTSWPGDDRRRGTATLIDNRHLLTCGHNLYDTSLEVGALQAVFVPGLTRTSTGQVFRPYPPRQVLRWKVSDDYRSNGGPPPGPDGIAPGDITRYLSDYAVARLDEEISTPPGESMMAYSWPGTNVVEGQVCTILGYSGDLDPTGSTQYTRTGPVHVDNTEEFVTYQMSTYPGDSGAPVFYQPQGRHYWTIVAVHVSGVPPTPGAPGTGLNFGPALPPSVLDRRAEMMDDIG